MIPSPAGSAAEQQKLEELQERASCKNRRAFVYLLCNVDEWERALVLQVMG